MKPIKPKVYSITSCGYELTYKCGHCERVFNLADSQFFYCPTCGKLIDWGVLIRVSEEWKSQYLKATEPYFDNDGEWHVEHPEAQQMRDEIDKFNLSITDGQKRVLTITDLTRKAIIRSNINYYLEQGWTKEALINKGFFTEKDFKIYEEKCDGRISNA